VKVGDLVKVGPSFMGVYMVTDLSAIDPVHCGQFGYTRAELPNCVMLASQTEPGPSYPMDKKWIEVISEAR